MRFSLIRLIKNLIWLMRTDLSERDAVIELHGNDLKRYHDISNRLERKVEGNPGHPEYALVDRVARLDRLQLDYKSWFKHLKSDQDQLWDYLEDVQRFLERLGAENERLAGELADMDMKTLDGFKHPMDLAHKNRMWIEEIKDDFVSRFSKLEDRLDELRYWIVQNRDMYGPRLDELERWSEEVDSQAKYLEQRLTSLEGAVEARSDFRQRIEQLEETLRVRGEADDQDHNRLLKLERRLEELRNSIEGLRHGHGNRLAAIEGALNLGGDGSARVIENLNQRLHQLEVGGGPIKALTQRINALESHVSLLESGQGNIEGGMERQEKQSQQTRQHIEYLENLFSSDIRDAKQRAYAAESVADKLESKIEFVGGEVRSLAQRVSKLEAREADRLVGEVGEKREAGHHSLGYAMDVEGTDTGGEWSAMGIPLCDRCGKALAEVASRFKHLREFRLIHPLREDTDDPDQS